MCQNPECSATETSECKRCSMKLCSNCAGLSCSYAMMHNTRPLTHKYTENPEGRAEFPEFPMDLKNSNPWGEIYDSLTPQPHFIGGAQNVTNPSSQTRNRMEEENPNPNLHFFQDITQNQPSNYREDEENEELQVI
jgi:hypothetical protein